MSVLCVRLSSLLPLGLPFCQSSLSNSHTLMLQHHSAPAEHLIHERISLLVHAHVAPFVHIRTCKNAPFNHQFCPPVARDCRWGPLVRSPCPYTAALTVTAFAVGGVTGPNNSAHCQAAALPLLDSRNYALRVPHRCWNPQVKKKTTFVLIASVRRSEYQFFCCSYRKS